MPTRCFMPPEISPGRLSAACESCTSSSAFSVRVVNFAFGSVAPNTRSTARWTFSKHVSHGSSEWFWNTTPRSGPGPAISRPAQICTPLVGWSRPATRLSSVDLPQPEWPISATNSPSAIVRLMSFQRHETAEFGVERHAHMFDRHEFFHGYTSNKKVFALPVFKAAREQHQRLLEQEADDADRKDRDDDVLDVQVVPLIPHQKPMPTPPVSISARRSPAMRRRSRGECRSA